MNFYSDLPRASAREISSEFGATQTAFPSQRAPWSDRRFSEVDEMLTLKLLLLSFWWIFGLLWARPRHHFALSNSQFSSSSSRWLSWDRRYRFRHLPSLWCFVIDLFTVPADHTYLRDPWFYSSDFPAFSKCWNTNRSCLILCFHWELGFSSWFSRWLWAPFLVIVCGFHSNASGSQIANS